MSYITSIKIKGSALGLTLSKRDARRYEIEVYRQIFTEQKKVALDFRFDKEYHNNFFEEFYKTLIQILRFYNFDMAKDDFKENLIKALIVEYVQVKYSEYNKRKKVMNLLLKDYKKEIKEFEKKYKDLIKEIKETNKRLNEIEKERDELFRKKSERYRNFAKIIKEG